ncbi:TatD DNase family protein [Pseudochelatococcus lubricantis]|uniref:TatD DNase family protein n=1 Tax=Pseudochelatococcus lubricantis TaxID=1538102 RepID=A0ABX0UZP2_9HYPH|nr:TatD family hydrolase [Pseudochelatococcus lubricantis]NIJ56346.1 TatD DNase family protein [Pseudochelatococcus lubricantis]
MLVDSHCHLDYFSNELDGVLARAAAAGVGQVVTISTRVRQVATCRAIAEAHSGVFFSVGTHPMQAKDEPDVTLAEIVALAGHPRCVAIGEAGLDYFYERESMAVQREVFVRHIAAARATGLPLVIHARSADDDMIAILSEEMAKGRFTAVLHCFSSGPKLAEVGVELGLYVSFSGILTFKKSEEIRDIALRVPLDRLLVETDAPYLAPLPFRGKRNEPAYVAHTARVLAEVRGMSEQALAQLTTGNFRRLFSKAGTDRLAGSLAA